MSIDFSHRLEFYRRRLQAALDRCLPPADAYPARLHEAMRYSCDGGKRLRALLIYGAGEVLGAQAARWNEADGLPLKRDHLSAISGLTLDGRLVFQVRPYSLLAMLCLLSTYALWCALRDDNPVDSAGGARFVTKEAVAGISGQRVHDDLWAAERNLPTPNEVDAPGLWLARIDLPS